MRYFVFPFGFWLLLTLERCCFPYGCCNPDTSKTYLPQEFEAFFPQQDGDVITYYSDDDSVLVIISKVKTDTSYQVGDECPLRPGEYFQIVFHLDSDSITFTTAPNSDAQLYCFLNNTYKFGMYQNGEDFTFSPDASATAEFHDEIVLNNVTYKDVISVSRLDSMVTGFHLVKDSGVIALSFKSIVYWRN